MDLWRLSGCEEQNLEKETFFNLVSTSPPPIFKLNRITKYLHFIFLFLKGFPKSTMQCKMLCSTGEVSPKVVLSKKETIYQKSF